MDIWDTVIILVGTGVVSTIIAARFVNSAPSGGGHPRHPSGREGSPTVRGGRVKVEVPCRTDGNTAPVVQNSPITEAAYNQYPTTHMAALGPDQNQAASEALLPI